MLSLSLQAVDRDPRARGQGSAGSRSLPPFFVREISQGSSGTCICSDFASRSLSHSPTPGGPPPQRVRPSRGLALQSPPPPCRTRRIRFFLFAHSLLPSTLSCRTFFSRSTRRSPEVCQDTRMCSELSPHHLVLSLFRHLLNPSPPFSNFFFLTLVWSSSPPRLGFPFYLPLLIPSRS